jgi:hypothetical protein
MHVSMLENTIEVSLVDVAESLEEDLTLKLGAAFPVSFYLRITVLNFHSSILVPFSNSRYASPNLA